ncbi:Plasmodium vivax Vir protein, putative [Plasmodium vivax]|uniref:Vir protein, putative n=1 Tax=Plasmodium vivax TaxID=5855 RepID=A0A1G4E6V0_PLAVI|nr:Plasmodium vivax Vir protein, putative [Plasmodium vivax]
MSSDVHEQICPLNRFIRELENLIIDIVTENNEALTNIGCSVYRGHTYLSANNDSEARKNFCDYLNLWLDEQKISHTTVKPVIKEEKWELIENLWNKLYEIEHPSRKCERQGKEKNASEIKKRMDLMVYCENRDYFKDLCKKAISWKSNVNQKCSLFNEFTDKNYEIFYEENRCFVDPHDLNDYRYYINKDCDLNNMPNTFPKFDSIHEKIVYDELRKPIEKCEHTVKVVDVGTELGNRPSELASEPEALVPGPDGLADDHFVQENTPPDSTDLDLSSLTVETSPENRPSKSIYYAGLSASGVFFTSMVLYKYTALGPLIRSLVSELPKGPDGLDDDHSRPDNRPLGSTDLGLSSLTVVTSPDNKPLKPVYYAGLSVSGVFFTSMVLYKV